MKNKLWREKLLSALHFDAHVIATLILRFWGVLSGGITLLLIPLFMGSVEQGYYFTFASILALQVFFELGFGQVIIQFVAHEAAFLNIDQSKRQEKNPEVNAARLKSLILTLRRWYIFSAVGFFCIVNLLGFLFFHNNELPMQKWVTPWLLLVTATAYNLMISWRLAFLEGFGYVKEIGHLRLAQSATGFLLMWIALFFGCQLWIVCLVPTIAAIFSSLWLKHSPKAKVMKNIENFDAPPVVGLWKKEIFPFQWRIALSWISGYFIFQTFTPVIFKNYGAIEAGKVGLGITIFNSVTTVSVAWVAAKTPMIGALIARGERHSASEKFRQLAIVSVAFSILAAIGVVVGSQIIGQFFERIAARLPSWGVMSALAVASIANSFVLASALFMRAHKEEPMLNQSIVMAIAVSATVFLTASLGSEFMISAYASLCVLISIPWTLKLLKARYYIKT